MFTTLICAEDLDRLLGNPDLSVLDCGFDLADPQAGYKRYSERHIPGAVYAHLDTDLSDHSVTNGGRHPLPDAGAMNKTFSRLGIANDKQVVLYDDGPGMFASRAWWMLRYLGHEAAAVLDGGLRAWVDMVYPVESGSVRATQSNFRGTARIDRLMTLNNLGDPQNLVDAREPRRYAGEIEPLDPRAGHIPGAANHFFNRNVDEDGKFLSPDALKQAFIDTLGTLPDGATVHYCGSGVSACHNVLAQVHAGLDEPRLYAGSWSEWCGDPARPAATGATRD